MKRFEVTYWVKHTREFWVSNRIQIEEILSEQNECKIETITELPVSDEAFSKSGE